MLVFSAEHTVVLPSLPKLKFARKIGSTCNSNCALHTLYCLTTTTTTTILRPFVRDYPGDPVPEETFNHSHILIIIQPLSASSIYYDP